MKAIVKHTNEPRLDVNIEVSSADPMEIESKNGKTASVEE